MMHSLLRTHAFLVLWTKIKRHRKILFFFFFLSCHVILSYIIEGIGLLCFI